MNSRTIEISISKRDIDKALRKAGLKPSRKARTKFMQELQSEIEGIAREKVFEWIIARMKEIRGEGNLEKRDDVEVCPNCYELTDELIDGECCDNCERYYKR